MENLSLDEIEVLKKRFLSIRNIEGLVDVMNYVATILYDKPSKISLKQLYFYSKPENNHLKYYSFSLKKKSGERRKINAPVRTLKFILRVLNEILQVVTTPSCYAFGFVKDKSIVDNARVHLKSRYIYNIDLKDFFHSFTYERLVKLFKYEPFNFNKKKTRISHLLAGLCTCNITIDGESYIVLPQGSPTSPTLSNLLCDTLDYKMNLYAKRRKCKYSRYADDITFSSDYDIFDDYFFDKIEGIIKSENLEINPKKTRLQKKPLRQEVTGLVVNEKVNVKRKYLKQIRMWLYYWEKYGFEKAQQIYEKNQSISASKGVYLNNVLKGKLFFLKMVKGEVDSTYLKLFSRFEKLDQRLLLLIKDNKGSTSNKNISPDITLNKFNPKLLKIRDEGVFFGESPSSILTTEIEGAEDFAPSPINPNNTELKENFLVLAKDYLDLNPSASLKDYIKSFLNSEGVSAKDVEDAFYYISKGFYEAKGENYDDMSAEVEKVYLETISPFNRVALFSNSLKKIHEDNKEIKENQKEFQDNKETILEESNEETQKETAKKEGPILRITRDGKVVRYEGPKTAAATVNVPFNGIPYITSMRLVNGIPHYTYIRDSQAEETLLHEDTPESRKRAFMMIPALTKVGTEMKVHIPTLNELENDDSIVVPIWTKNDSGFLEKTLIPFNEWLKIEEFTQEVNAVGEPVGEKTLVDKSPGSKRFLEKVPVYMTMDLNGQQTNMSSAIHDVEWWNERNVADFMDSAEYHAVLDSYDKYDRNSANALEKARERAQGLQQMVIDEGRAATLEVRERIWEETQANREGWENKDRGVITEVPMEITAVTAGPTNQLDRNAPKKSIQDSAHKDLMVGVVLKGEKGLEFAYTSKDGGKRVLPNNLLHNPGIMEETAKLGYVLTAIPFKLNEEGNMTFLLQMVDNGYSAAQPKLASLYETKLQIEQTYANYRRENTKDPNSEVTKTLRARLKDIFDKSGTKNYENILRDPPRDGNFLYGNVTKHYPFTGANKSNPSIAHYQVAVNKDNLSGDMANIIYFDNDGNAQVYKPFPESNDSSYVQMLKENIYTNHTYAEIRDLTVADPKAPNATKFVANVQPRIHFNFIEKFTNTI